MCDVAVSSAPGKKEVPANASGVDVTSCVCGCDCCSSPVQKLISSSRSSCGYMCVLCQVSLWEIWRAVKHIYIYIRRIPDPLYRACPC